MFFLQYGYRSSYNPINDFDSTVKQYCQILSKPVPVLYLTVNQDLTALCQNMNIKGSKKSEVPKINPIQKKREKDRKPK